MSDMLEGSSAPRQGEPTVPSPVAPAETGQSRPLYQQVREAVTKAAEEHGEQAEAYVRNRIDGIQSSVRGVFEIAERALVRDSIRKSTLPDLPLAEKIRKISEIAQAKIGRRGPSLTSASEERALEQAFFPDGGIINLLNEQTSIGVPFLPGESSEAKDQQDLVYLTQVARNLGILHEEETWGDFIQRAQQEGYAERLWPDSKTKEPVNYRGVATGLPGVTAEIFFHNTPRTDNGMPLTQNIAEARRIPEITLQVSTIAVLA